MLNVQFNKKNIIKKMLNVQFNKKNLLNKYKKKNLLNDNPDAIE